MKSDLKLRYTVDREIFAAKKFSATNIPTPKITQAKYFVWRTIRYISHVYASSKGHNDEN